MRVFLVRHGETNWNKERRMQGQADISLNDFGRRIAHKTKVGLSGIAFDKAYTSPLCRAKETAEIILEGREIELIEEPLIIEMSFGIYEGKSLNDVKEEGLEEFSFFFNNPSKYKAPEQGENFECVKARMQQFLLKLEKEETTEEETFLIVTHGAAIAGILNVLRNESLEQYWENGVHHNCGVTELLLHQGVATIVSVNRVYYEDEVKFEEKK